MRKFSAAVQESETQDKIAIDPKEIPKASKYSFHDNRFSSDKKVFQAKKMGKKELKMDQKWEHDKFVTSEKKQLKVNIVRKEKISQNITVSLSKNPSPQVSLPTSSPSSQNQPLTSPASDESTSQESLAPKESRESDVQVKLLLKGIKPKVDVGLPLPPKPKTFKHSKSFNYKDKSWKKNTLENKETLIPDPLQMVPQMMIPPMYQEPNYIYSPYMTNSGQILYMTENGLFVPSPVGFYPTYVPSIRSKAIPIIKPSE